MNFTEIRELTEEDINCIMGIQCNDNGTKHVLEKMTGEDFGKFLRETKKR